MSDQEVQLEVQQEVQQEVQLEVDNRRYDEDILTDPLHISLPKYEKRDLEQLNKVFAELESQRTEIANDLLTVMLPDGSEMQIRKELAKMAGTIKTTIEDTQIDDDDESMVVPLPGLEGVSQVTINRIFGEGGWCEYHFFNKDEEYIGDKTEKMCEWDKQFTRWFVTEDKERLQQLVELMNSANYLNIEGLVHLCAKVFANILTWCKTPEKMRELFGTPQPGQQEQDMINDHIETVDNA